MQFTVPGEWEEHSGTIVAWPTRSEVWQNYFDRAYDEYSSLIRAIAASEPVLVVATPGDMPMVTARLGGVPDVHVIAYQIDDGWIRDNGPIFGRSPNGLAAVDFDFNSWGNKFSPSDGDRSVGARICDLLSIPRTSVPWVLEGGAITFNGEHLAIASAECVLHPTRNGAVQASEAKGIICEHLGLDRLEWLPFGLLEDLRNTDGHVDNVAVFISPERVLAQICDKNNCNYDRMCTNIGMLRRFGGVRGQVIEVIECEWLPYCTMPDGTRQPASYLNFTLTEDAVILPTVGSHSDETAGRFFADLFPDRNVIFTPAVALTFGGGGPHCVTMQVPAGVPSVSTWPPSL